jgi:hypothetical protein
MQMIDNDPEYQTPAEERLQMLKDEVQDRDERIGQLETVLNEIYDLIDGRQNFEIPNQATKICWKIDEVLGKGARK